MTGPEQHAATERIETLARGLRSDIRKLPVDEREAGLRDLDELVALAGRAEELQNECHEWNALYGRLDNRRRDAEARADEQAQAAMDNYNWGATNLERAEAAVARADELQRERDEARRNADGMARAPYGEFEAMREARDEARREADQLREKLESAYRYRESQEGLPTGTLGYPTRAALAGVQADSKDSA